MQIETIEGIVNRELDCMNSLFAGPEGIPKEGWLQHSRRARNNIKRLNSAAITSARNAQQSHYTEYGIRSDPHIPTAVMLDSFYADTPA